MDRDAFWQVVEAARTQVDDTVDDADHVAEVLADLLAERPVEEILGFQAEFELLERESYRLSLWAAAYLINGGCSDDGFDYFRGWLVAQGRTVFEAALVDPDSLAALFGPDAEGDVDGEDVLAAASIAYERVTGDADGFWTALEAVEDSPEQLDPSRRSFDFDFEDDAEMRARLPRLAEVFLEDDDD